MPSENKWNSQKLDVQAPERKQHWSKRNVAFPDTIPALIISVSTIKEALMEKWDLIQNEPLHCTLPNFFLQERKIVAKNTLVRAKILKVNTRFHTGIDVQPVPPCSFSPKIIYVLQKAKVGVSLCVQFDLSSLLFTVPCNQQGNQVRICNNSFGDFIGTILENKGERNYHVASTNQSYWSLSSIKWCIFTSFTRFMGIKVLKLSEIHNKC